MEISLWLLLIAFVGFGFNALSKQSAKLGKHKVTVHIPLQSEDDDLEVQWLEKEFSFATAPRTGDVLNVEAGCNRFVVDWVKLDDEGGIISVCKEMFISQNQLEEEHEGFLESGWRRAHSIGPPPFYRNSPPHRNHETIATGHDNFASRKRDG